METKSLITSKTVAVLLVGLLVLAAGKLGVGVTDEDTQNLILGVTSLLAIIMRWFSKGTPVSVATMPKLKDLLG